MNTKAESARTDEADKQHPPAATPPAPVPQTPHAAPNAGPAAGTRGSLKSVAEKAAAGQED